MMHPCNPLRMRARRLWWRLADELGHLRLVLIGLTVCVVKGHRRGSSFRFLPTGVCARCYGRKR